MSARVSEKKGEFKLPLRKGPFLLWYNHKPQRLLWRQVKLQLSTRKYVITVSQETMTRKMTTRYPTSIIRSTSTIADSYLHGKRFITRHWKRRLSAFLRFVQVQ